MKHCIAEGISGRGGFRFRCRRVYEFESLRPHHFKVDFNMLVQLSWQSTPLVRVRSCVQVALQAPFGPLTQRQSGGLRIRSLVVQSHPGPPSNVCVCGETGKRVALRALWWQHFIGSSPITRTKMSLWRNRQTRTAQTRFVICYGFNSHQTYHFIEGSHSGLVQWFAKSPNKFIVPRVQIPLPLPYRGVV